MARRRSYGIFNFLTPKPAPKRYATTDQINELAKMFKLKVAYLAELEKRIKELEAKVEIISNDLTQLWTEGVKRYDRKERREELPGSMCPEDIKGIRPVCRRDRWKLWAENDRSGSEITRRIRDSAEWCI
jgi:hypothetical protein